MYLCVLFLSRGVGLSLSLFFFLILSMSRERRVAAKTPRHHLINAYKNLVHASHQSVDVLLAVTRHATFDVVISLFGHPTQRRGQLHRPQEVRALLEVRANGVNLVNQIFDANDTLIAQHLLHHAVIRQRNSLLVNLTVTSLVNQIFHRLQVRVTPHDVRLNLSQSVHRGFVHLHEDAVVNLSQSQQLQNVPRLRVHVVQTSQSHDKDQLLFRFDVEAALSSGFSLQANQILLLGFVLLHVLFGALEHLFALLLLGLLGLGGVFGFLSGPLLVAFAAFENGFWSGNLFCLGMKRKKKSARQSSDFFYQNLKRTLGKTFAKWVRERRVPRDARAKRNVQNVQKNILNGFTQSHHPHNLRDALSDLRFRAISRRRTLPKQKFRESAREEKKAYRTHRRERSRRHDAPVSRADRNDARVETERVELEERTIVIFIVRGVDVFDKKWR